MTTPCILYHPALLIRHVHIILQVKKKIQKYIRWTRPQSVKPFVFVTWLTVAGPQTERILYSKYSWASWERWLGRIPCCCCLQISRPQQKPIQTLYTSTCALSLGASHLARLLWTGSRGIKARIPGFMWNPIAYGASMEVYEVWSWPRYLLWYHVKLNEA